MEQAPTEIKFKHRGDQCDNAIKIWIIINMKPEGYTLFQSRPFIENLNTSVCFILEKRRPFKRVIRAEDVIGTSPY